MFNSKKSQLLLIFISALFYAYFAYLLNRSDFFWLFGSYSLLFFVFVKLIKSAHFSFSELTWISIGFRLVFLFSLPSLSQDFYRFIWDGRMIANGISPYLLTPNEVLEQTPKLIAQADTLINGMQDLNASHYSNYPPVSQWVYFMAAKLAPQSILSAAVSIRFVLILADIGIIFFGKKILDVLKLPQKTIFWFALNPLIILELTGNLHFEGLMLLLLLVSIYLLLCHKWIFSAFFFGLSVATKLLPLVLLPLFYHFFRKQGKLESKFFIKGMLRFGSYSAISISVFALSFLGLADENFIQHFGKSLGLWFGTFEFNASFYYAFRWIGYQLVGWNTIATLGKILPVFILLFVLYLSFLKPTKNKNTLFVSLLFATAFYFFFSTTVHPWYLATPLLLSVFTRYKFMLVWSFLVMLSYAAYQYEDYHENLWLVSLEYVLVFAFLAYELFFPFRKKRVDLK